MEEREQNFNKSNHIFDLSNEIISDIELSRIDAEQILLKSVRLARLTESDEIKKWLELEMRGYRRDDISFKYMDITGRFTEKEDKKGYWISLPHIEAIIKSETIKLQSMRTPDSSSQHANLAISNANMAMSNTSRNISKLKSIVSSVISLIYEFALSIYYTKRFEFKVESIFDKYKSEVDDKIYSSSKEIVEKFPAIIDRLNEGSTESICHSLTSCRRLIDDFADFIYPASDSDIMIDGNKVSLKGDKVLNRINAYVNERTQSRSRKQRIRQNLANLYDRVSAGVHSDLDNKEAKALFFNVYLILGEILDL